ncbi:uncharacterized protein LOC117583912 [Drosophila guanche]|uniref:uncharacterized protein LOC117583912 n=1 Tax=Drosophila guanche TaxID=7266 RepID=UPI0014723170|nr:uncharacterized protein LOC117583912 [Drosophila guanche]
MPGDERLHTVGTGRELRVPLIIKCQNSYSKFKCCLTLAMAMALRMCLAGRPAIGCVESGRFAASSQGAPSSVAESRADIAEGEGKGEGKDEVSQQVCMCGLLFAHN